MDLIWNLFEHHFQPFHQNYCKNHSSLRKTVANWYLRHMHLVLQFVGNKAKGRISERVFHENKARQIFRKTNISYPLICTSTCAYQGVRNGHFSENLATLFSWNNCFEIRFFPLMLLWPSVSRYFCHFSIISIKHCSALKPSGKPHCSFEKIWSKNGYIWLYINLSYTLIKFGKILLSR